MGQPWNVQSLRWNVGVGGQVVGAEGLGRFAVGLNVLVGQDFWWKKVGAGTNRVDVTI